MPKKDPTLQTHPEPTPPKEIFEPKKNETTLDDRIDELIAGSVDTGHPAAAKLRVGIKDLIQRVTFPHEFCPNCDDKMFYQQDKRSYRCINCGYDTQQNVQENRPSGQSGKSVPAAVNRALENASQVDKGSKTIPAKIRPKVSQIDEDVVRQDPNIKGDVNWV